MKHFLVATVICVGCAASMPRVDRAEQIRACKLIELDYQATINRSVSWDEMTAAKATHDRDWAIYRCDEL